MPRFFHGTEGIQKQAKHISLPFIMFIFSWQKMFFNYVLPNMI